MFGGILSILIASLIQQVTSHSYLLEYNELTKYNYFVDKTPLIEAVLRNNERFSYISCPRFFGKTTNLKMLRSFAQVELDENAIPKIGENATTFQIFRKLYIEVYDKAFNDHIGSYSTFYLNLQLSYIGKVTTEELFKELSVKIQQFYKQYEWFVDLSRKYLSINRGESIGVDEEKLAFMDRAIHGNLTMTEMQHALAPLINLVYSFIHRDTIIMVDDYDNAAENAILTPGVDLVSFYATVNAMILEAFEITHVKYGIITAVGGLLSNLSFVDPTTKKRTQVSYYPFLSESRFAQFFGFCETETNQLLDKFNCTETEKQQMIEYYKGYQTLYFQKYLYNPYTVTKYMINKREGRQGDELVKSYWAGNIENKIITEILKVPKFRQQVKSLLSGNGSIVLNFDKFDFSPLQTFMKFTFSHDNFPDKYIDLLWRIFFDQGYLTHDARDNTFTCPNLEIKNHLKTILNV